MIARDLADKLAEWLDAELPAAVNVYEGGDDTAVVRPAVVVSGEEVDEHELMRGNFYVTLVATLTSVPEDTDLTTFRGWVATIEGLFVDTTALAAAILPAVAKVHDVRTEPGEVQDFDGLRMARSAVRVFVECQ